MRTVIYGAAVSLDGFLAGPNGEIDWLEMGPDVQEYFKTFWPSLDTILIGRKTYDVSRAMGGGPPMPGITATYVFSRTIDRVEGKKTHLVRDDAAEFVRKLKQQPGKKIYLMGGGDFARSMFAAGLVDEVELCIEPILLGAGLPMFLDSGARVPLTLVGHRTIDGRSIMATYRVG